MKSNRRKLKIVEAKLGRQQAVGLAYFDAHTVVIDPRQPSKEYMDTLIHECLHLLVGRKFPERKVKKFAGFIARALWKQGFRKIEK